MTDRNKTKEDLLTENALLQQQIVELQDALVTSEAARSGTEAQYKMLFERMFNGFAVHEIILDDQGDPCDYRFLKINPAFTEMTGLTPEMVEGKRVLQVIPDTEQYWIDMYGKVALTEKPLTFDNYAQALDKHFEIFAFSPQQGQFATIFTDITERKKMEESLRESRKQYQAITEVSPVGIFQIAPDGTAMIYVNKRYTEITGYTLDDLQKENWINFIHPDDRERLLEDWQKVSTNMKKPTPQEMRYQRPDGEFVWVLAQVRQDVNKAGEGVGFIGTITDITERKQMELTLVENEAKMRSLLEQAPFDIQIYDLNGTMLQVNQAWEKLFQAKAELVQGLYNLLEDEQVQESGLADAFNQVVQGEVVTTPEFEYTPEASGYEGRARWLYGRYFPLTNQNDEVVNVVLTHVDVTDRHEAELERERLQQEIITAQKQAIQELSTPIIPVMDQIIVLPLIGSIDSMRARDLMRTLLQGISEHRAKIVIMDMTGVPLVDTGIAAHLDKAVQAARLKGARVIITGISDSVAETVVDLGIDWSELETLRNLQTGLITALHSLEIMLHKK